MAIMCAPCRRQGGYFVPVRDLVLASLEGTETPHPIYSLVALVNAWEVTSLLRERGVDRITVAIDDLAVVRSWMLPPESVPFADLWPHLESSFAHVVETAAMPIDIKLWSQVVDEMTCDYEAMVASLAEACLSGFEVDSQLRGAFGREVAKRLRFERATGRGDSEEDLRARAAAQVANYAAQGVLLNSRGINAYLGWTEEEIALMSIAAPGFADVVLSQTYGTVPREQGDWSALPARFADLREELQLYSDDLPQTPGRIRPGLADAVQAAMVELVTVGTEAVGERKLKALNRVLPGGPMNRNRVEALLEEVVSQRLGPGWRLEQAAKKLWCHMASRYTDNEAEEEYARHARVLRALDEALPASVDHHVALALTGSLIDAPDGMWHPYFSDIDVMPLFATAPSEEVLTQVRAIYAAVPRPSWLYLNEGAKAGVAGLSRDPARSLFAADRLSTLTGAEFAKLSRLVAPMRRIGGSAVVFDEFLSAYRHEKSARDLNSRNSR
ncbi:hypothetical protein [Nocardiopsis baichengensis]|uniref:hypothetical protein n=1 Tax=Nocardiopsis baichengensis TaxID=280240 RepID=UPI0013774A88|nr:hypothetical protein [Nocardiopsis baichengensis]